MHTKLLKLAEAAACSLAAEAEMLLLAKAGESLTADEVLCFGKVAKYALRIFELADRLGEYEAETKTQAAPQAGRHPGSPMTGRAAVQPAAS